MNEHFPLEELSFGEKSRKSRVNTFGKTPHFTGKASLHFGLMLTFMPLCRNEPYFQPRPL